MTDSITAAWPVAGSVGDWHPEAFLSEPSTGLRAAVDGAYC